MGAKYDQLDLDERIEMSRLYEAGTSRREIGRIIGRSASAVGRFAPQYVAEGRL